MKSETLNEYLNYTSQAEKFMLGDIDTEKIHSKTVGLSDIVKEDINKAINILKEVDADYIKILKEKISEIEILSKSIKKTIENEKKVYLFGCGATGRLSISLEVFCRMGLVPEKNKNSFIGFMSGGDAALIRSIEQFEDYTERGARQLEEIGFKDGDLLISCTEGGETPIVIGATEKALELSKNKPYYLYSNPNEILIKKIERSKKIINNKNINKICLANGQMAISGSTRMQSSTVLMAAVGFAIENAFKNENLKNSIEKFIKIQKKIKYNFIKDSVLFEENVYKQNNYVIYKADEFGVTVLTDTTERSPTFSLTPFENILSSNDKSGLVYLCIPNKKDSKEAWNSLLKRNLRTLEWEESINLTGIKRVLGFDISENIIKYRKDKNPNSEQVIIEIKDCKDSIEFILGGKHRLLVEIDSENILIKNLILKMILNIHSTLLMGRLGRYKSNVMTYVKPSNNKLIDRSIRYIDEILKYEYNINLSYNEIAYKLFEVRERINVDESIVLNTVEAIRSQK